MGHTFIVEFDPSRYEVKVDGKGATIQGDVIKFTKNIKLAGKDWAGIKPDAEVMSAIKEAYTKHHEMVKADRARGTEKMEAERPSPRLDETTWFPYKIGFDTHQIYPKEAEKAIKKVLKSGEKAIQLLEGKRAGSGYTDRKIPESYATKTEVNPFGVQFWKGPGYSHMFTDGYALPRKLVEAAQAEVDRERKAKNAELQKDVDAEIAFKKAHNIPLHYQKCWECGQYKDPKQLDETGYCGC